MPTINAGDEVSKALVVNRFNEVMRDAINPVIDVGTGTPFSSGTYSNLTNAPKGGVPFSAVGTPTVAS